MSKQIRNRENILPLGMKMSHIVLRDRGHITKRNGDIATDDSIFQNDEGTLNESILLKKRMKMENLGIEKTNCKPSQSNQSNHSKFPNSKLSTMTIFSDLKEKSAALSRALSCGPLNKNRMTRKSTAYHELMSPHAQNGEIENFLRLYGTMKYPKNDLHSTTCNDEDYGTAEESFHFSPNVKETGFDDFNLFNETEDHDVDIRSNTKGESSVKNMFIEKTKCWSSYNNTYHSPISNQILYDDKSQSSPHVHHNEKIVSSYFTDNWADYTKRTIISDTPANLTSSWSPCNSSSSRFTDEVLGEKENSYCSDDFNQFSFTPSSPNIRIPFAPRTNISQTLDAGCEVNFENFFFDGGYSRIKNSDRKTRKKNNDLLPLVSYPTEDGTLVIEEAPYNYYFA